MICRAFSFWSVFRFFGSSVLWKESKCNLVSQILFQTLSHNMVLNEVLTIKGGFFQSIPEQIFIHSFNKYC